MSADRRWELRTRSFSLQQPLIVGVVNLTPDSFSDGGLFANAGQAVDHALRLVEEGADILDLGGESTRPGSEGVSVDDELERVLPVVAALAGRGIAVSVDTSKAAVAAASLNLGAEAINDVTAGRHHEMLEVVAGAGAGLVLMHMQGEPRTMQVDPHYGDIVGEISEFLSTRAQAAIAAGVPPDRICIDPGVGFGKNLGHNLTLLAGLQTLRSLGYPLMVGVSRKSFLGRLTGVEDPAARDLASAVAAALAVERGADVLRVHNVAACREAVAVAVAIVRASGG